MSGYTTDDSRRSPSPNGSFYDSTADRRSSFSLAAGDGYGYGNGRWSSLTRDGFRGSTSSLASMGSVQSLQQPRRESVIEALEKKRRDNVSARLRNLQLQLLQRSASVSGGDVEDPMLTTEAAVDLPIIAALPRRGRENVLPRAPRRHSAAYQQVFAGGPFTAGKADDTRSCTDSPASTLRRHSLSTSGLLDGVRGYGRRSLSVFGDATDSDCVDVTSVSPSSVTARHPSALSAAYAADHSSSATCNGRHNGVSQAATDANGLTTLQTETFQSKSLQPAAEEEVYGKSNDRYSVDEENELRSSRVEASSDAAMPSSCHPQQQKEQQRAYLTDDVDVHRSAAALKLQPPRPPTDRLINDRKFTSDDEDYSVDDTAVAESVVSCDDTSVDSFTYCSPAVERNATRRQPSSQQLQQKPQSPDSASFTSTPVDRDIHMPSVEGAQTQLRDRTVPKANRPASLSSFSVRHGDAKTVASSSSLSGALLSPLSATIESPRGRENYDVDRSTGNERLQAAFSYPSIATAVAMSEMSQRGQHQSTSVNDGKRLAKGDETRKPPIYRSAVSLCISTPSPAASVRLRNASTAGLNRPPAAAAASENGRQAHSRSRSDDQTSSLSSSLSDQRHVSELRLPASGRPQPAASSSTLAVAPASPTFKSSFSVPLLTQTTSDFQESTPRNSAFAAAEENNSCHSPLDARPPPLPASEQPPIGALFAARQRFNSWDGNGDDDNSGDRTPISHLSPSTLSPLQSAPSGDVIDALNDGCRRDLSTRPETSNEDASRRPISGDVRTSVGQSPSTPQKSSLRFSFPVTDQMNPNITTSNPSALNSRRNHRENVYEENLNGRSDVPQPPKATCDVNGA